MTVGDGETEPLRVTATGGNTQPSAGGGKGPSGRSEWARDKAHAGEERAGPVGDKRELEVKRVRKSQSLCTVKEGEGTAGPIRGAKRKQRNLQERRGSAHRGKDMKYPCSTLNLNPSV